MRCAFLLAALLALGTARAQGPIDEAQDFGVPPSTGMRLGDHASPTPREIPGAHTITTPQLRRLLQASMDERPLLFDVLGGEGHETLPGTIWLPGAGRGESFDDEVQAELAKVLDFATGGNRSRMLVFFCTGPRCWLSYNAALRAMKLGYANVAWYRGGIQAWGAGGGALTAPRARWKYAVREN